jgi:hypothetical protein
MSFTHLTADLNHTLHYNPVSGTEVMRCRYDSERCIGGKSLQTTQDNSRSEKYNEKFQFSQSSRPPPPPTRPGFKTFKSGTLTG